MQPRRNYATWSPPPGFVAVPSAVPGIEVYAPAPEDQVDPDAKTFRCPQCNGLIAYDAGDQQLACPHCGYTQEVGARVVGLSAGRFEFTLETLDQSERGWGIERRSIQCASCNAVYSGREGDLSTTCPFCGTVCEHYESAQCHLRTSCTKSPFPTKKSYWFDPRMLAAYDKNGMTGYHADTEALMTRQRPSIRYVPMFTPSI